MALCQVDNFKEQAIVPEHTVDLIAITIGILFTQKAKILIYS